MYPSQQDCPPILKNKHDTRLFEMKKLLKRLLEIIFLYLPFADILEYRYNHLKQNQLGKTKSNYILHCI